MRTGEVVQKDLYAVLRDVRHIFEGGEVAELLKRVDRERTLAVAGALATYIDTNLPAAVERRESLGDYRTNPYVLLTAATVMRLGDPDKFASFLFNSKLYMALETSFGKSVESALVGHYPVDVKPGWADPEEKLVESAGLRGLKRQDRARRRTSSVWREIDKAVIHNRRRYLISIKSGPNTINDTQVQAMTQAIIDNHPRWLEASLAHGVDGVDIVVGLTYGTPRITNNKDNQILAKLLDHGFVEADRSVAPGTLVDVNTGQIRVYRVVGSDFWAFIGDPSNSSAQRQVYLEVLLALSQALAVGIPHANIEERLADRMGRLAFALAKLTFPKGSLPDWIRDDLSEEQLFWFATALTAFFDEGI